MVTCSNPQVLAPNASSTLDLKTTVNTNAASGVIHTPKVSTAGDRISANNKASDPTVVATPTVGFQLAAGSLTPGAQTTVGLIIPNAFPGDVSGTLRLSFSSNAAIPLDDPAIQFSSGGREVPFTIPANTVQARFGEAGAGAVIFQPGTVAGTLSFEGTLQTGTLLNGFAETRTVARQAPTIHGIQMESAGNESATAAVQLTSTLREVTQLVVRVETATPIQLNCGVPAGCSASGNSLTLDVKRLFDAWFAADREFGSISTLRIPFSFQGQVQGNVVVQLRNNLGGSNPVSFPLP
jgi:hypothetical protein